LNGLGSELVQSFERGVQAINAPDLIPHAVAEHRVQELLTWLLHVGFVFNSDESAELQRKVRLMIGAAPEKNWISKDINAMPPLIASRVRAKPVRAMDLS
jgi:hypothetical protein